MKRILKVISFVILPIITVISCTIIGKVIERKIYEEQGAHPNMSGAIASTAWMCRGVYAMMLIIAFSFVLYSNLSKTVKAFVFILMLILNLPVMYFMDFMFFIPLGFIIIPVINLITFTPVWIKQAHNKA